MISKTCAMLFIIIVVSNGICVFGQNKDVIDSTEIIRRYKESLSWVQSVSMKIDIKTGDEGKWAYQSSLTFRQDGNRVEWLTRVTPFGNQRNPVLGKGYVVKDVFTGKRYFNLTNNIDEDPTNAIVSDNYEKDFTKLQAHPKFGGVLQRRMYGSDLRSIPELLIAHKVSVRDNPETIDGTLCHVLETTTKYGRVTVWISPEKSYNALKWVINKSRDHFFDKTTLSDIKLDSWTAVFDSVELQKIGDVFVPKGGAFTLTIKETDGNSSVLNYEYKISNTQLNPDFDTLGAFKIDYPNGLPVLHREFPAIKYVWQDGKLVTRVDQKFIADLDSRIEQLGNEVNAESVAVDKNPAISREESAPGTQTGPEEAEREAPEVLSESGSSPVLTLILIGLLIIVIAGWLMFRKLRA